MDPRRLALDALMEVDRGAQADAILRRAGRQLDARDAALATELTYGVLRRRNQVDWLIEKAATRPLDAIQPPIVLQVLRLGVYQMRFLTRIPMHAAVNETVELVKRVKRHGAAGFVNAVMRRIPQRPKPWASPALEYSLPLWLAERWMARFGAETMEKLGPATLREPWVWVRVPPGSEVPANWKPSGVAGAYVARDGETHGFRRMDIGAQSLLPLLDLQPGQRFLDVCAAPGNKTAQALESGVVAVACDSSGRRLREFLLPDCPRVQADAAQPLPFGPVFDRILVDAPCSGTGTLGRNPEIRWRIQPEELALHADRQRAILRNALACLKPGGQLVYATCSLEPEENEEVVQAVAADRVRQTALRIPGVDPGDGFFAALLQ
jgi:16S rRNA (cytosine967-C5)-methyltransferase